MEKVIIIKYGELSTKKDNKNYFISKLKALGYSASIDFSMGVADYVKWVKALR